MRLYNAYQQLTPEQRIYVTEATQTEPDLSYIFDLAARDQTYPGYDRALDYERFKSGIRHLVGWDARNDAVASSDHYLACLTLIDMLLPPSNPVTVPELFLKVIA